VYRAGDRGPAIQDSSGIYKIIGPVKNKEDNRRGTMELSLRHFIRGTVGAAHLKEGLPTHSADKKRSSRWTLHRSRAHSGWRTS
jgi:hypothetical protein